MKCVFLIAAIYTIPSAVFSQQYRNLDVGPNASGGYSATYGRQNFEIQRDYNQPPQRRQDRRFSSPPAVVLPDEGVTGRTYKRCYVTGNGNRICR